MHYRHHMAALVVLLLSQANAGAAGPWETLHDCRLVENTYNDGDSFRVRQGDREFIFRLYFVDTPEAEASISERVRDQADYFGITPADVMAVGRESTAYVRQKLSQPFTVVTRWQGAQGRSKLPRYYAFVNVGGEDLARLLVSQGLARVYGVRATTPDGVPAETTRAGLLALEDSARHERLGAWTVSRQLNVAAARHEAARSDTKVIVAPHTVNTYTEETPRRRLGEVQRDEPVHVLEEFPDGWVRIAYQTDQEGFCLRWDLGLPELPSAPIRERVEQAPPSRVLQ